MGMDDTPPEKTRLPLVLALVGPGILVAATGVGAGDLATAAFAGNHLGVGVLWAVVLGAFLKFVLNEGVARWQLGTGETLLEGAIGRFGRTVWVVFLLYLLLWSFFVGAALISASGVALHAILPLFEDPVRGKIVFGMLQSLAGVGLVMLGGFRIFRKIMLGCIGLMFLTVVITAIRLLADWPGVVSGLLVPRIPDIDGAGLGWTVALMGGVGGTLTVLCYGYWMQETGRTTPESLGQCRLDLALAYAGTAVFGICMVIIGSSLPELSSGGGASLVVNLAGLLEGSLGPVAKWVFLLGTWSAIFSSLFGVWQSVPYLFADLWAMGWTRPGHGAGSAPIARDLTRTPAYRYYLWGMATLPLIGLFVEFRQVQQVYAIFGALFMPILALLLLVMNGRRSWVGHLQNRTSTGLVLLGTLAVFLLFGWFRI
jgi:Mn2+/Fe2+ NRAMP family transporter